jgi:hypothetical protein
MPLNEFTETLNVAPDTPISKITAAIIRVIKAGITDIFATDPNVPDSKYPLSLNENGDLSVQMGKDRRMITRERNSHLKMHPDSIKLISAETRKLVEQAQANAVITRQTDPTYIEHFNQMVRSTPPPSEGKSLEKANGDFKKVSTLLLKLDQLSPEIPGSNTWPCIFIRFDLKTIPDEFEQLQLELAELRNKQKLSRSLQSITQGDYFTYRDIQGENRLHQLLSSLKLSALRTQKRASLIATNPGSIWSIGIISSKKELLSLSDPNRK